MATASFSAAAEDDLSCPVCFNLLKDPHTPKELDCSHVFCAKCIQQMIEGGRRIVDCPECRHTTRIPKEGVDAMKTVYRLRSLAEKHHEHAKKTAKHQDDEPDKGQDAESVCPEHNIIIDFFCRKCNVTGCSTCMVYGHQRNDHDVISIASAYSQQLEEIANIFGQMSAKVDECEQSIRDVCGKETDLIQRSKENKEQIEKHLEAVVTEARENTRLLQKEYDSIEQPKIDRTRKAKQRLEKQRQNMTDIKTSVENTLATSTRHKYVKQHAAISKSLISQLGKDCKVPEGLNPLVGKARLKIKQTDMKIGSMLQVKSVCLSEVQDFGFNLVQRSLSIVKTNDGALVVGFDSNALHVYRRNTNGQYKKENVITLSKKITKNSPRCIAVSSKGKLLIVREDVCIEMYSQSGQYEGVLHLQAGPDRNGEDICKTLKPRSMAVDEDGSMIIADAVNSMIIRFSTNGTFINSIVCTFPPHRITSMPNGEIAATNWRMNKLVLADMKSGIDKPCKLTVDIPQVNAICYHKQSDTLLVGRCLRKQKDGEVDEKTGVIEQYCPTSDALVKQLYKRNDRDFCDHQDMVSTNDGMLISAEYMSIRAYKIVI